MAIEPMSLEEVEQRGLYPRTQQVAVIDVPLARLAERYGMPLLEAEDDGLGPVTVAFGRLDELVFAADQHEHSPYGPQTMLHVGYRDLTPENVALLVTEVAEALEAEVTWQVPDEVVERIHHWNVLTAPPQRQAEPEQVSELSDERGLEIEPG